MPDFPVESHWTDDQRTAMQAALDRGDTVAYWCSDAHGYPCNGGASDTAAHSGLVQTVPGVEGRAVPCGPGALHATRDPHRWVGNRVWIVACSGVVDGDGKIGCLRREILGDVLPQEALDARVGVLLGRTDLGGADLNEANLGEANLCGANLCGANLCGADLGGANLGGADIRWADLGGWERGSDGYARRRAP